MQSLCLVSGELTLVDKFANNIQMMKLSLPRRLYSTDSINDSRFVDIDRCSPLMQLYLVTLLSRIGRKPVFCGS